MIAYIDSDVILDSSLKRDIDIQDSVSIMGSIKQGDIIGKTSVLVIANIFYLNKKENGILKTIDFIKYLLNKLDILSVTREMIKMAIDSQYPDFEDAIQYFCAVENKVDCIITRNIKHYKFSKIPVYTPTEFIKIFKI